MNTSLQELRRRAAMQDALLKLEATRSLGRYVEQAWPVLEPHRAFLPNWHLDYLIEHLELVSAGEIRRLLINMPPRSMKSLLVSVLWPTWEWISEPGQRWVFASYADSLSIKHSLDRRTVLQSPWYQERWGATVQLAADQNEKQEFQNTARGVMIATSVGGSITGKGGERIVVDDPHNPTHIGSDVQREAVIEYFQQTLSTRLDNKKDGAMVVVMQRLHQRDLSAVVRDLGYMCLELPAEAERTLRLVMPRSGRIIERHGGDILWPAREGKAELDELRKQMGPAAYAAQYQQQPMPEGGQIFEPSAWKFYDDLPALKEMAQSWDMTFKGTANSDFVVGFVAGRVGADIYLIDRVKGQWEFPQACHQVEGLLRRYPRTPGMKYTIWVEETANGPALITTLGRHVPGIVGLIPKDTKVARARAVQPLLASGNIFLPDPKPHGRARPDRAWVEDFIHQCAGFPGAKHDDDVDAFTQLVGQWLTPTPPPVKVSWAY